MQELTKSEEVKRVVEVKEYGPKLRISKEIHAMKYRTEGESFKEGVSRFASALKDDEVHYYKIRDILLEQAFMGGGRTQAAIGAPRQVTPFNCFVSEDIEDSMDSIMDRAKDSAQTMRVGGGIGYCFSALRPKDDRIVSLDSKSSGPISFMNIFNAVCHTISSAGHRRGAQMGVLRIDHPDIEEFIHAKQNETNLKAFNLSIAITDEFMEKVIRVTDSGKDELFNLTFEGRVYKQVSVRNLWEEVMRSTWDWAEPGVLFIDRMNQLNNLQYCEVIKATNPCG
jgi:ribonucleoside-diphosphate reductase alpha chain